MEIEANYISIIVTVILFAISIGTIVYNAGSTNNKILDNEKEIVILRKETLMHGEKINKLDNGYTRLTERIAHMQETSNNTYKEIQKVAEINHKLSVSLAELRIDIVNLIKLMDRKYEQK